MSISFNEYLNQSGINFTQVGNNDCSDFYLSDDGNISACVNNQDDSVFSVLEQHDNVYREEKYNQYSKTTYDFSNSGIRLYPLQEVNSTDLLVEYYHLNSDYFEGNEICEIEAGRIDGMVNRQFLKYNNNDTGELEQYYEIQEGYKTPSREMTYTVRENGFSLSTKTTSKGATGNYDRNFIFDKEGNLFAITENFYGFSGELICQNEYYDVTDEQFDFPEYQGDTCEFLDSLEDNFENSNLVVNYRTTYDQYGVGKRETLVKPESHKTDIEKFVAGLISYFT